MKNKNTKTKILTLTFALVISQFVSVAQKSKIQETELKVYKRFALADTSQTVKHGVIVMYTNNTYVNFGFCKEGYENAYFMYSTGTWATKYNAVIFKLTNNVFDTNIIKKGIKAYYKTNKKYLIKQASYDFVKEFYVKKELILNETELVDQKNKIVYRELKI